MATAVENCPYGKLLGEVGMKRLAHLTTYSMLAHAYAMEAVKVSLGVEKNLLWYNLDIAEQTMDEAAGDPTEEKYVYFVGTLSSEQYVNITVSLYKSPGDLWHIHHISVEWWGLSLSMSEKKVKGFMIPEKEFAHLFI